MEIKWKYDTVHSHLSYSSNTFPLLPPSDNNILAKIKLLKVFERVDCIICHYNNNTARELIKRFTVAVTTYRIMRIRKFRKKTENDCLGPPPPQCINKRQKSEKKPETRF